MNEICNFCGAEYHRIEDHCCSCTSLLQQLAAMTEKRDEWRRLATSNLADLQEATGRIAAMTKERDSERYKHEQCVTINERLLSDIRCIQAREAKLRGAMLAVLCDPEGTPCFDGSDGDRQVIADALALPFDDSPLQERLKQERERCANWLRRNANAEKDQNKRAAFIEAHNAIMALT